MLLSHTGSNVRMTLTLFTPLTFGDLLIDVFDQHVRHRTVGGGEGHADIRHTVRFVVYFVDQPQVVDIDRDFGVVDILERGDDIFFYL